MKLSTLMLALGLAAAATPAQTMSLTSSDLAPGATIATRHIYPRCGGQNESPQLSWSGPPAGTKSYALTMIDLDVKPSQWSHWIVVGLPAQTTSLARGAALPSGATAVVSNFGDAAYDGPCPPTGSGVHHYEITIWALPVDAVAIAPDEKAAEVSAALAKIALAKASLTGWVKR